MNAAVGLMDGLGLDGDRCIRVIPRHSYQFLPFNLKQDSEMLTHESCVIRQLSINPYLPRQFEVSPDAANVKFDSSC